MGGWGRQFLNISPAGKVLPCHAAESITSLTFDRVGDKSLREIWLHSPAFEAYRGTAWMQEPCRPCERRARKRVVAGKSVSVRVDLGGPDVIKKKKNKNN